MIARDLMTPDPVTVEETASVGSVIQTLYEVDVRHVPVVRRGELVGVVSSHDLRTYTPTGALAAEGRDALARALEEPISHALTGDPIFVNTEDDITDVIELMIDQRIGAVPVVAPGGRELVGIISYVDVLREAQGLFET